MSAIIACHITGRVFDVDALDSDPYPVVPGTKIPVTVEGVDAMFPAPGAGDPQREAKITAREQALADVKIYQAAAKKARKG